MQHSERPLVSVIIPIHNRQDTVLKTLNNVKDNNYRPLELVLVDDGSEDNVASVLKEFKHTSQKDNFEVKLISQRNSGASSARNSGVRNASGDYIQFLDSDDFLDVQKFETQIDVMRQRNADFGLCDFTIVYINTDERKYCSNAGKLDKALRATASFGCGSPLLHKSLVHQLTWDTGLTKKQDVDYFLRAALIAEKIAYVDQSLYTYIIDRTDQNRISASYNLTRPVYRARIDAIKSLEVPSYREIQKKRAIISLKRNWLKHHFKDKWLAFKELF